MSRLFAAAAIAASIAALGVASSGSAQTKTRASDPPALTRSKALVASPAAAPFVAAASIPAATARVIADEVAREIPLPEGGTFSGVRWEAAGGVFSRAEIAGVLQYNASCQWLRAWRDGREASVSERVLADVPSWPALRGAEATAMLAQIAAETRAGGGRAVTDALVGCDASHEREAAYAPARGLATSR